MANTTWITLIKNDSGKQLFWRDGENHDYQGYLSPGSSQDCDGSGLCFPWVDHTKDELYKAIEIVDPSTSRILFRIFQSYNRDTIQWLNDPSQTSANHAVDVKGESAAGGCKAIYIQKDYSPMLRVTG